jgi:molecular chaperone DnaJ
MAKRDYYEVLEVSRNATPEQLKKSYRRLAMKYHPDQNPDDDTAADKFKELTEAFQVLSDPQRRAQYDQFGHEAPNMGFGGATVDISSMTDFFESIFGSVFGGARPRRRRRGKPGRDLKYDLEVSLEDAVRGAEVKITVPRPVRCDECNGSRAAKGTSPTRCRQCDGAGTIRLQQGLFSVSTTCVACGGSGETIARACEHCNGRGLVIKDVELDVTLPPGVDDGAVKVLTGAGEHGLGGAPDGDLVIMVHLTPHDRFIRRGSDLHSVCRITYPQASLGAEVAVKTIDDEVKMRIKPGTEHGQLYRLRGKGVPALRGASRGDQIVHIEIDVPAKLTPRQKELLLELGKELGTDVQTSAPSFVEKLRSLFD